MTNKMEKNFEVPWSIGDAPGDFTDRLLSMITGFELSVISLEGRAKVSQNKSQLDQKGVLRGLKDSGVGRQPTMFDYVLKYGVTDEES